MVYSMWSQDLRFMPPIVMPTASELCENLEQSRGKSIFGKGQIN